MNRIASLRVAGLFLVATSITAAGETDRASRIDEIFASFAVPGSPGAAVSVIQDGKVVFAKGYGLANLELDVPITPQSVFYLGSVSKQFVAASIALLEQDGQLSFDDDVRKFIPDLPEYGAPITVRQLIHHTSGLRDYLSLMNLAGLPLGTFHDNEGVVDLIARQRSLNFDPGEKHLYSNSGYLLLAVIVEKASGKSLREYAAEKIFEPLGMNNTHFHDDYMHLIPNRASGYFPDPAGGYRNFLSTFDRVGSGGMFSNLDDLYRWDQNFYSGKVGGKAFIEQLHETGTLNDGEGLTYAFGLTVSEHNGLNVVQHGGALGGYRSTLVRVPEERFSVIILANVSSAQPGALALRVADVFLADRYSEADDTPTIATNAPESKAADVSPADLERVTGLYWNADENYSRRLYVEDGTLMYWRSFQSQSALAPRGGDRFRMLDVSARVDVVFDEIVEGKATRMTVTLDDGDPAISRAYEPVKTTPDYLTAFEGTYHSKELQADYAFFVRDRALVARLPDGSEIPLKPALQDLFTVRGLAVHFNRDEEQRVNGFMLDAGRVQGLQFERD